MSFKIVNPRRGLLFIISAPAGTGKTTLVQMLTKEFPNIVQSISTTTRQPRKGEIDGVCYHFVSDEQFQSKIAADDFLEYVELYGYSYGTSKEWVAEKLTQGNHVFLVIDTQGAQLLQKKCNDAKFARAIYIFVAPPSIEELQDRLIKRGTETAKTIEERLKIAEKEMEVVNFYDYFIVNDELATAYKVLKSIVTAEEHRVFPAKNH